MNDIGDEMLIIKITNITGTFVRANYHGGFAWKAEYPVQSRRAWLTQYESKVTGAGAHADARETPLLGQ